MSAAGCVAVPSEALPVSAVPVSDDLAAVQNFAENYRAVVDEITEKLKLTGFGLGSDLLNSDKPVFARVAAGWGDYKRLNKIAADLVALASAVRAVAIDVERKGAA